MASRLPLVIGPNGEVQQIQSVDVVNPPSIRLGTGAAFTSGTGSPDLVKAGSVGDIFFRTDATLTVGQRIYICSVTGGAGSARWTATAA